MAFKKDEFSRASFNARTREIKFPELKEWFDDDSDPIFIVRGLTGEEFYNVRQAATKRNDIEAIASKLFSGDGQAIAEAIQEYYGAVPEEFIRRVEVLIRGCVDPELDRPAAMKLFKHFPSQAHLISEEILKATGEGAGLGESKGCGEIPASDMT